MNLNFKLNKTNKKRERERERETAECKIEAVVYKLPLRNNLGIFHFFEKKENCD